MNKLIYKPSKLYKSDINDLVEDELLKKAKIVTRNGRRYYASGPSTGKEVGTVRNRGGKTPKTPKKKEFTNAFGTKIEYQGDRPSDFVPSQTSNIQWKTSTKLSGAKLFQEAKIITNRNKFYVNIKEWDNDSSKKFYAQGKPVSFSVRSWVEGGNFSDFIKIEPHIADGLSGEGTADSVAEAKKKIEQILKQYDKKFFRRKPEFYPYG